MARPRSRLAAALVALSLFLAGGYLAWIAFASRGTPDSVVPGAGEVHRIRLDGPPQPTAAGEGAAWTAVGTTENDDLLWRIDAATEKPHVLPNTRGAGWPAVGEGFAWVTCTGKDNPCRGPSVLKLDPDSGETLATITLPEYPFQISTGLGAVWVTMSEGLAKLDPVEGQVTAVFPGRYNHVGTAGGSVWATSYDPDRVYRIDPNSGKVLETLSVGSLCRFEASDDVVWLATCVGEVDDKETLTKIDAKTAEVLVQAPLASYGQMRAVGETLWFASHAENRSDVIEVVRLDPQSGRVAGEPMRISTGDLRFMSYGPGSPGVFVAADDRSLWLTDFGAGEVIRLGLPSVAPLAPQSSPSEAPSSPGVATTPRDADEEGSTAPVLVSAEHTPDPVLGGEPVTFVLHWRSSEGPLRAVICKTNLIAEGVCPDGAWATGYFSSSSPAVAQYLSSERAPDVYLYYPFVCDSSGACSEPIKASPNMCPHLDVVAEARDDPGPYECDQSPAVADKIDYSPAASPTPISGITGRPRTSGFKTEVWSVEETLIEDGLRVIVSTAPGTFALTGGAIDGDTGEAVVGALVVIETSRGVTVKTRTDDDGTFAFIDVPIASQGERVVFSVRAAGYEFHRVVDEYDADTYAITAELDRSS